jgi:hypothetical protein
MEKTFCELKAWSRRIHAAAQRCVDFVYKEALKDDAVRELSLRPGSKAQSVRVLRRLQGEMDDDVLPVLVVEIMDLFMPTDTDGQFTAHNLDEILSPLVDELVGKPIGVDFDVAQLLTKKWEWLLDAAPATTAEIKVELVEYARGLLVPWQRPSPALCLTLPKNPSKTIGHAIGSYCKRTRKVEGRNCFIPAWVFDYCIQFHVHEELPISDLDLATEVASYAVRWFHHLRMIDHPDTNEITILALQTLWSRVQTNKPFHASSTKSYEIMDWLNECQEDQFSLEELTDFLADCLLNSPTHSSRSSSITLFQLKSSQPTVADRTSIAKFPDREIRPLTMDLVSSPVIRTSGIAGLKVLEKPWLVGKRE